MHSAPRTPKSFASRFGIICSLFWEISVLSLVYFFIDANGVSFTNLISIALGLAVATGTLIYPLYGWIGDSVIGRYRAVKYSLITLWAATIMYSVIAVLVNDEKLTFASIPFGFFIIITSGCFFTSNLHFGIDQLSDAPSWQISSYVSWYCWSMFLVLAIRPVAFACIKIKYVYLGYIALILTIALCLDALGSRYFVKEPISSNLLQVIFPILKYTIRNKYPRLPSSFSFWHHKLSRINLAKTKYGGPFTSEEVESVKTFFKMLVIIPAGSLLPGCFLSFKTVLGKRLTSHYHGGVYIDSQHGIKGFRQCLVEQIIYSMSSFLIVVGVPVYERVVYPILRKSIASVTIAKKIIAGMAFLLFTQLCYLILEVTGHVMASERNVTIPCFLNFSEAAVASNEKLSLSMYWLCLPNVFNSMAYYLMFTAGIELLCAQSPHNVKGFLFGWMWSTFLVSNLVDAGLKYVFSYTSHVKYLSCGGSFFLFSTFTVGILTAILYVVLMWYSKRRWRDNCEDESIATLSDSYYQDYEVQS